MSTSPIAVIANREGLDTQALLGSAAREWREAGAQVVGVIAEEEEDGPCSAGFLCDIATGQRYSIQLSEAPEGTVCHLDANGVDAASAGLLAQIPDADVIVLAKFGKLEGMERGLWHAFKAAIEASKPVLTTVSEKHVGALEKRLPRAEWLEGKAEVIAEWWQANRRVREAG